MGSQEDSVINILENIRKLSPELVKNAYAEQIPQELAPPASFWASYDEKQVDLGLRSCLLLWAASGSRLVPREFQLRAVIATMSGEDSLIDVGTGQGKTLCLILPCLLAPETISLIVSPLKRLQAVQVLDFERHHVKAIAINEDTPNDPDLWKRISEGGYSALLAQPEQLVMNRGHMPRLARLISQDRRFNQLVHRLQVDEAHFIYSAGLDHYGLPAFRPPWGRLGEIRIKLGKKVTVQALSGTQPPHIKKAIIKSLHFDESKLCSIKLSSNRPNIIYATHQIVNDLSDFRNLDFLIPLPCPTDFRPPKTLVFHDDQDEAAAAALYIDRRLPAHLRDKGIVQHYHGCMSKEYLTSVYEDFSRPDGTCRILHATEGASTGLDISDIEAVIQYGISRDVPTTLQRGGRGGRASGSTAVFLIMYEPWIHDIKLDEVAVDIASDPDHPNTLKLTIHSRKRERTGVAMIQIIQDKLECLRRCVSQSDQSVMVLQGPSDPSDKFKSSSDEFKSGSQVFVLFYFMFKQYD